MQLGNARDQHPSIQRQLFGSERLIEKEDSNGPSFVLDDRSEHRFARSARYQFGVGDRSDHRGGLPLLQLIHVGPGSGKFIVAREQKQHVLGGPQPELCQTTGPSPAHSRQVLNGCC